MKFTNEETLKMATTFKKQFIANGLVAHVIKRKSGKNTFATKSATAPTDFAFPPPLTIWIRQKQNFYKKPFRGKSKNTVPKEQPKLRIISDDFMKKQMDLVIFPTPTKNS